MGERRGRIAGHHGHHERGTVLRRITSYRDHHLNLIDLELEHEMEDLTDRLKNWPKQRLTSTGTALFDLEARTSGWMFSERIIALRAKGSRLPDHRFGHGDMVRMSRGRPLDEWTDGVVLDRDRRSIRIVVSEPPRDLKRGVWRIDRGANRVAHDRMRTAIERMCSVEEEVTVLRDALMLGLFDPDGIVPGPDTSSKNPELDGLNTSQRLAVLKAAQQRITLIQGPPGTGKTTTAVAAVRHLLSKGDGPVLVTAESNVGVDNLLEGLIGNGVPALRLGQPVKVRAALREATLDARMIQHPLYPDLEEERRALDRLSRKAQGLKGKEKGLAFKDRSILLKHVKGLERKITEEIIERAPVICATCIGSGHDRLDGIKFPVVVLDEATQATEPSSLVPITKGAERLILVGDHAQLPPTVISQQAEREGLAISLFERCASLGFEPELLDTQYRMHPIISEFPSARFYDHRLVDGITSSDRPAPAGVLWPNWDRPVAFVPVHGRENVDGDSGSRSNMDEASLLARLLQEIIETGELKPVDIGVITPYIAQVRLLRDLSKEEWLENGLEIRSVDGYQGREKELILFSAVRSNDRGEIGFLADKRRLNVAITRPRRGLIVVGDPRCLGHDPNWSSWLDWIHDHGLEAHHLLHG